MSGSANLSEHSPDNWKKATASFIAGVVVGLAQLLQSVLTSIFRILVALA